MFQMTETFVHQTGFRITPIEMQGVGFIFLPKELEEQLGYENLAKIISNSETFIENIEYLILRNDNLNRFKELLRLSNTIGQAHESIKYSPSLIVLTELGLYTVILLSRKPESQAFRRWVTGEVLPSIRKTGIYKMGPVSSVDISGSLPELVKRVTSLEQTIAQTLARQEQFQQYALCGFDRIEAVLSDSLPHDMFAGWAKIKGLVDDMTGIYGLTEAERKRYFRELCQSHDIHLPEKALLDTEPLFHDLQEIAIRIGVYSVCNKPHEKVVGALIRHLHLTQAQYCRSFPLVRRGYSTTVMKYSDDVIPHLVEWLQDKGYPEIIEITSEEDRKARKFKVRYRFRSRE